jgi:uncharacterized protein (DUF433 family)
MSETRELQPTVVRNERGLSINGTRITLYDVMDYLRAGLSPEELQEWLPLSEQQVAEAIKYIATHRAEVEAEYHQVLAKAEENRRYWEVRNRDRLARIASMPPKPEHAAAWAKLQALKNGQDASG